MENAYEDFIAPYIRDMRSRGTYSERTLESLSTPECEMKTNHELIATLVHYIHTRKGEGAILIFVPGWDDISKVNKLLTEDNNYSLAGGNTQIFPLHSLMPTVRKSLSCMSCLGESHSSHINMTSNLTVSFLPSLR